jgi:hypothetical protein
MTKLLLILAGIAFFALLIGRAWHYELDAHANAAPTVTVTETYQNRSIRWWAARAVINRREANQNRRNAEARGRTIRRLQSAQLTASAHFFAWLAGADCVQRHEGAWTSATGNGYYGGLQADVSFQRTYAPDLLRRYGGLANTWPWYAQLQMGYRGWLFRGWSPWPNTARECGLR